MTLMLVIGLSSIAYQARKNSFCDCMKSKEIEPKNIGENGEVLRIYWAVPKGSIV